MPAETAEKVADFCRQLRNETDPRKAICLIDQLTQLLIRERARIAEARKPEEE
jgi:hypothetical protein